MAYTPTTWATGDTITASKMNKIENGIANAGGGEYDLDLKVAKSPYDSNPPTVSDIEIISGSLQTLEAKLMTGEPVTARLSFVYQYNDIIDNCCVYNADLIDFAYRYLSFSNVGISNINTARMVLRVFFDASYNFEAIQFESIS